MNANLDHVPGLAVPGLVPPTQYPLTTGYWAAADDGRLVVQRCDRCGTHRHLPAPVCHACQAPEWSWSELSGSGSVYSYTWVRTALTDAFAAVVPFNVCVVELDGADGVRLAATVTDVDEDTDLVGTRVQAYFAELGNGHRLLLFAPV